MTVSLNRRSTPIKYPETDGQPMTESDSTRRYLIYSVEALSLYFKHWREVYVSGNLFIYFEEGNPKKVVTPDVFVVIGVEKKDRRSYKTWEEGNQTPNFVLEITSKTTKLDDQRTKPQLYAQLGIQEYFQYDPTGDYLCPQLQGGRLVAGEYQPIVSKSLLHHDYLLESQVLGLELRIRDGELRFYDASTGLVLMAHAEEQKARLEAEDRAQRLAAKLRELNIDPDSL